MSPSTATLQGGLRFGRLAEQITASSGAWATSVHWTRPSHLSLKSYFFDFPSFNFCVRSFFFVLIFLAFPSFICRLVVDADTDKT